MAAFTIQIQVQSDKPAPTVAQDLINHLEAEGHTVLSATTTNSVDAVIALESGTIAHLSKGETVEPV